MMDSSPQSKNPEPTLPMAGTKRPAPSLLPAFEPLSSSPGFPRPSKRQARPGSMGGNNAYLKYPTPIPTSSTGILSSSPPRVHQRPGGPSRAASTTSERTPLGAVASIELNENGDTLLMGRSSNSSHYQLSANRLVSRVHVKARYVPAPSALEPNKMEIVCNGWNGLKLHSQGKTWELQKGDSFTSETEGSEIMLDVQDARVMILWPKRDQRTRLASPESSWDGSPPRSNARAAAANLLQSSPLRHTSRIESPDSPTPAHMTSSQRLQALLPTDDGEVHIYEDSSADEPELPKLADSSAKIGQSFATEVTNSFSSDLSEPEDNDPDEENDPIVHSFGPFGADISNRLASVLASSPKYPSSKQSRLPTLHDESNPSSPISAPLKSPEEKKPREPPYENPAVRNHVVNQLAFSRLSSNPLSAIMNNLPTEQKKGLAKEQLRSLLENTACIGIIRRQGKDAAGKPLESEYYYVPEADDDEQRRFAVTDGLRKPSLRACRKQHKQYYWKRPRTP
ncbi:transcription factor tos4 [Colletotrichum truncatum]|uniref:Transcription factor tos4 n=1 Tax=Colletotrichum truncatum TaxID=5467 RepID=A0ACC3YF05_COLTU|nr:transcription factor tos4 [Colletotrichum truncatum]KAF6784977.1 transcription factor tos4 [Colletotrichum truncatum]